jgi:acyl carrier protein
MEMNEAREVVVGVLGRIAPEIDPATIDPQDELQVQCDLDSMDFLTLVEGVSTVVGRDIPERDYPQLMSLQSFAEYLSSPPP